MAKVYGGGGELTNLHEYCTKLKYSLMYLVLFQSKYLSHELF